ncbi:cullin-2 [Planoprotostelium fungivorum]|uniref:Cullin-2 n=1 Tax=Planoprotostelium fungivorum TaxID=1890364 RepID=A0A2P6NVT9_9EUKA|nr:cullin-2 [Planoprotostelium fungivorum]
MGLSPQKVDFDSVWKSLSIAIEGVLHLQPTNAMPLIQPFFLLVLIAIAQGQILTPYLKHWQDFSLSAEVLNRIFGYMNANWIKRKIDTSKRTNIHTANGTTDVYEIGTLALITWRDKLFHKIKGRVMRCVLDAVTRDRDGDQINVSEVTGVMNSYVKLGSLNKSKPAQLYKDDYETPFIKETGDYYASESSIFIMQNGVSAFMARVENRLEEEKNRGKVFMFSSSADQLKRECELKMIEAHKERIQGECSNYLKEEKIQDLGRMYRLFSRIENGIRPMLEVLQSYIASVGFDYVKRIPEKESKEPKRLSKSSKSPEFLAKYCDILLKKSNKNLEESELDEKLNQIIVIFRYVDDKDVFQKFYTLMLARRLIQGTSVSDDAESQMISRLKQACGYEYTSKLQRMFTDMSLSTDLNDKFHEYVQNRKLEMDRVDFNIQVLTAGSWPMQTQSTNFNVPQELEKCIQHFQNYYMEQHQGRKLAWLHHLSKGDIRTCTMKKKYEFQVTSFQMAILLLFNTCEGETIRFESMTTLTGLKDTEVKRAVESLVEAKVLLSSEEKDTPSYSVNEEYSSKRLKVKLAGVLQKETKQENDTTHKGVEDDRRLYLQAAIVRVMKARKSSTHNSLVQDVIVQAKNRFQPSVQMIKKCIEHLIEKEYLERVEGETDKYNYVA